MSEGNTEKSIFDLFEMDNEAEMKGIVVNYGPYGKFTIARAGGSNERYKKALEAKTRPHRRRIENGSITEEELTPILVEIFVDTVLLGWEGVKGKGGVDLQYNRANAIDLFTKLPDLFIDIRDQASKSANFRVAEVEADAKN